MKRKRGRPRYPDRMKRVLGKAEAVDYALALIRHLDMKTEAAIAHAIERFGSSRTALMPELKKAKAAGWPVHSLDFFETGLDPEYDAAVEIWAASAEAEASEDILN